jgi:hypothetical protein
VAVTGVLLPNFAVCVPLKEGFITNWSSRNTALSSGGTDAFGNELILAQRGAPTRYDSRYHNALHQAPNDLTVTNIMDNFFT